MVIPVEKNIRYRGFSLPQPIEYGIPVVQNGDWLAERAGTLVYHRQPWEADVFVRTPQEAVVMAAMRGMSGDIKGERPRAPLSYRRPTFFARVLRGLGWSDVDTRYAAEFTCSGANSRKICGVSQDRDYLRSCGCTPMNANCMTTHPLLGQGWCCPPGCPTYAGYTPPTGTVGKGGTVSTGLTCQSQTRSGGTAYWRGVQQALCNRGHDPGVIDGRVGPNTRGAIRSFQTAVGISPTGRVGSSTASALGVRAESRSTGGVSAGAGITTDGTTPPPIETRGALERFFDLRSPALWLSIAGALLIGGGALYMVKRRKGGRKIPKTRKVIPKTKKQRRVPKTRKQ